MSDASRDHIGYLCIGGPMNGKIHPSHKDVRWFEVPVFDYNVLQGVGGSLDLPCEPDFRREKYRLEEIAYRRSKSYKVMVHESLEGPDDFTHKTFECLLNMLSDKQASEEE